MTTRADLETAVAALEVLLRPPMRIEVCFGDAVPGHADDDDGVTVNVIFIHPHGTAYQPPAEASPEEDEGYDVV